MLGDAEDHEPATTREADGHHINNSLGFVDEATPDAESDDGESDNDDEPELETCGAGEHLPADLVAVGQRVAVPFRIDSVESFCPGSISSVTASRVFVEFADGKWQVARERLFAIAK